jgi:signal transduction histidine kinase
MRRAARWIDLGVGLATAANAALVLGVGGWAQVAVAVLGGLSGAVWRRPSLAVGLAVTTDLLGWLWAGASSSESWNVAMSLVAAASLGAFAPATWTGVGVVALAVPVGLGPSFDISTVIFAFVLFFAAMIFARSVAAASRRARFERATAEKLSSTSPEEVARRAVAEERLRLAADVHRVIRRSVTSMRERARAAAGAIDADPVDQLRALQREGQQAIGELRRLLGLLRDVVAQQPDEATRGRSTRCATAGSPSGPSSSAQTVIARPDRPRRRGWQHRWWIEVTCAAALVAVALVELHLYGPGPNSEPLSYTPVERVLTALAASMIVFWRWSPGIGAAGLGGILMIAALGHATIGMGFWFLVSILVLPWSAMFRRTTRGAVGMAVLLAGAIMYETTTVYDELSFVVTVIAVVGTASYIASSRRAAAVSAVDTARQVSALHSEASEQAVRAERLTVARELHDVVSHAVVVMVVQGGAAEALLYNDRAAAANAIELIERTATATLDELDRLMATIDHVNPGPRPLTAHDLPALVERMRAGGLDVEFDVQNDAETEPSPLVYRIVQETLTNALRYAPNAHVRVRIAARSRGTIVEVTDDGPGPLRGARRGYGLIGMTERVEHVGGSVQAGPGPGGSGFCVVARLAPVVEAEL